MECLVQMRREAFLLANNPMMVISVERDLRAEVYLEQKAQIKKKKAHLLCLWNNNLSKK